MLRTGSITLAVVLNLGLTACGGGGGGGTAAALGPDAAQQAVSNLCGNVVGMEAIIWDMYNGIPRTDNVLPPPFPVGPSFTHRGAPLLGFHHPVGWTPTEINGGIHNIGVNLIRDDNQAIYRSQQVNAPGNFTAAGVRDTEIQEIRNWLGLQGAQLQVVCSNDAQGAVGGGFVASASNIMFRIGSHTAIVVANTIPLGISTSITVKVVVAPTAEFPARALDTFIAIDWQMNLGENANLFDRDGDGWRDGVDAEPDNPFVH